MRNAQRKAVKDHRRRQKARALVRVEVQAPSTDAALLRAVAATFRGDRRDARRVRATIRDALRPREGSLLERLTCDLPDDVVDQVLARRGDHGRDIDL